jgi:hypothetical protein
MRHFITLDKDGEEIIGNLTDTCKNCFDECNSIGKLIENCPLYNDHRRQGIIKNTKGCTFLCCDTTKTTQLFKNKIESLSYTLPEIQSQKKYYLDTLKKAEQKKVNRLVHNLTSLNAHTIQEIYNFVPQETLNSNWVNIKETIKEEMLKNPDDAAMMFLRISKHNLSMKSEFSIYKKLDRDETSELEITTHNLRKVLLNVLHTFFIDFRDNSIQVRVLENTSKKYDVNIDYETIQVAFYHLIENATKYTKPNTTIYIDFEETDKVHIVNFKMRSIYVAPKERNSIFDEGVSGSLARKMQKNGDGIGLWRIKQMIELNYGELISSFGDVAEKPMGFEYADNIFKLKFIKAQVR